jgi:hypothetical protein
MPWRFTRWLLAALVLVVLAACGSVKTVPGPATTVTATETATVTETATATISAPPPAPGTQIGKWSGSGNEVTPAFNVPDGGAYVVTWSYYGNVDNSLGTGTADNFSISNTSDGIGDLPNNIAVSGHGSTEVTDITSATETFNVEANENAHWTITVKSAS